LGIFSEYYRIINEKARKRLGGLYSAKVLVFSVNRQEIGEFVNSVIFNELLYGKIMDESRKRFLEIIEELKVAGTQGIILGCTEIPLLIRQEDTSIPLFDTLMLHASKAVDLALGD